MKLNKILLKEIKSGFVLNKPLEITVKKSVIEQLKEVYVTDGERGGVMWLETVGDKKAEIKRITLLQNLSGTRSGFAPSEKAMQAALDSVVKNGCLPIVFHTHPTNLGLQAYDNKEANFYLRASKPDRIFSENILLDEVGLYMPEIIFVKDERFKEGYALALYGGKILPTGFSRLTDTQIVIIVAAFVLQRIKRFTTATLLFFIALFAFEESKRPDYLENAQGDFVIRF